MTISRRLINIPIVGFCAIILLLSIATTLWSQSGTPASAIDLSFPFNDTLQAPAGALGTGGYGFSGDPDTGFSSPGANQVQGQAGNTVFIYSDGVIVQLPLNLSLTRAPFSSICNNGDGIVLGTYLQSNRILSNGYSMYDEFDGAITAAPGGAGTNGLLGPKWNYFSGAGGVADVSAGFDYGAISLDVASNVGPDYVTVDWDQTTRVTFGRANGAIVFEALLTVNANTTIDFEFGLGSDSLEQPNPAPATYAVFRLDTAVSQNWFAGGNGGALVDTTILADPGNPHDYRLEVDALGNISAFIDGTQAPAIASTMGAGGCVPYFNITANAVAARGVQVDFVKIWQNR